MGVLGSLVKTLHAGITGKRTWTPAEVRELIDKREFDAALAAVQQLSHSLRDRAAEQACLLGEVHFLQKRDADAAVAFRKALGSSPGMPAAHHGLSILLAAEGKFDLAAQHAQFAHTADRSEPRFLAQLGYCHLCLGNFQIAEAPLRHATRLGSENGHAWNNLGIVMRAKGQLDEARDCFQRATSLLPDFDAARSHLDQVERELAAVTRPGAAGAIATPIEFTIESETAALSPEDMEAAIDRLEEVVLREPGDTRAVIELAQWYDRAGDPQSGLDALEAHLARSPEDDDVRAMLGLTYAKAQQGAAAVPLLAAALDEEPDRVDLLSALAQSYSSMERFQDAGPLIQRAHDLAPDDAAISGQYAATLANMCRYDEALEVCEAVRATGKEIGCYGAVLSYLGRFDEAVSWLDRALSVQGSDPNLRFQRAQIHLLREEFSQGWDDYAFRGLSYSKNFRVLPFPHWRGESLDGKKIVVLAEQGLGDQIMFASCLPDLLRLGAAEIVVEVIGRIAPTVERSFPGCRIVATRQDRSMDWVRDLGEMDYFVPLGDLPAHFRRSLDRFPPHRGYLIPDPDRVAYWRQQLEASGPGPYIGISWRGGTEATRTSLRTIDPARLAPFARALQANWVSLQYGEVTEALESARAAGLTMAHWPESISVLDEFAALITALDLVVTVCNTTVHYAGALGKDVWVMAPQVPEWRYGLHNASMPWYPSSRMFRQDASGQWEAPIEDICQELSVWQSRV